MTSSNNDFLGNAGGGGVSGQVAPQTYRWTNLDGDEVRFTGYWDANTNSWVVQSGTVVPENTYFEEVTGGEGSVDPLAIVTKYYVETCIPSHLNEPTTLADVATGHGYLKKRQWTIQQFEGEGDVGGGLESIHSFITEDTDGVWTAKGAAEVTESNVSTAVTNETNVQGNLVVWEGAIYRPEYYHLGTNAGKRISTFRLYDAYTATNQSDNDRLQIGVENGYPSLDRSDLTPVANAQVGTSYDLPSAWAGRWASLAIEHSDRGNSSQVNWRVHIELEDGTILTNQALNDWIWNIETKDSVAIPEKTQSIVQRVSDPSSGITTWYKAGVEVIYDTLCRPIQEVSSSYLPIDYDVITVDGIVTITNVALGDGAVYEYSFDGGLTWQTGNTYSLGNTSDTTENDIEAIYPMVRDSSSISSGIFSPAVLVGDPVDQNGTSLRTSDLPDGITASTISATTSDDSDFPGGWNIDYSRLVENIPTNDLTDWAITGTATVSGARILVNNTVADVGNFTAEYATNDTIPSGEKGNLIFNLRNYYYGTANTQVDIYFEVVDSVTGDVLADFHVMDNDNLDGSEDLIFNENTLQNLNANVIEFTSQGNPVNFRIRDLSTSSNGDAAGHWWDMWGVELFDGYVSNNTSHFWSAGNYIEARGILADENEPAIIELGYEDVSQADLIKLTGNIVRVGTLNPNTDGIDLQVNFDDTGWISVFRLDGNWDIANLPYLTPYETDTIDTSLFSNMKQRLLVWSDGNTSKYVRIYDMSHLEVQA